MLFVCLDILSELEAAVSFKIQPLPCHDGAWAQFIPEVAVRWQTVQPEHACLCHLRHHSCRDLVEWQGVVDCPHLFLDHVDEPLNVPHVFIPRCFIQRYTHACHFPPQVPKLSIHEGDLNTEPLSLVYL